MLIIFDLDDTLIDTSGCIIPIKLSNALNAMIAAGLKIDFVDDSLCLLTELDNHSSSGKETLSRFMNTINADLKLLDVGLKEYYGGNNVNNGVNFSIRALEGANEVLNLLKKNHKLALVSIGINRQQFMKIKKAGLNKDAFSRIIITRKGDKKMHYQQLLDELGFNSHDSYVCGDSFERDLLPAGELGIKTILLRWGRGKKSPPPVGAVDYSINNLREILNIVKV